MPRFKDDLTALNDSDAIAETKHRLGKVLTSMGVLDDLSDAQREQITERVFSTTRTYQVVRNRVQERGQPVAFSSRALGRLHTRVRRLRTALDELAAEASAADSSDELWMWLGCDFVAEVLDELEDRVHLLPGPDNTSEERSPRTVQDVRTNCSSLLVLAFVVCGIPFGPASWRVAQIENTFWEGNVQETDESTNRKRSSAILKRLQRPRKQR